ncbi:LysR family transcriptional regulator [Arabiibacter massiliensis]|uniref:LysR family transcriptional regulator n=1 Tax=Arabiibacter massiliensis TaxID=1870985 RepID=UPI0009B9B570|nr:LysR family transcriptional regulator [Arabiibacter massiliensis]
MKIKQLRYFVAVVDHGSLSRAAKAQYVTVQAVSKAIADLEGELGRALFERESDGMHPTPFARAFHVRAERVLARFDELESFAATFDGSGGKLARLRLALNTPAFNGNEIVRENTAAFLTAALGIECTMDLATAGRGLEGLRSGEFDALVTMGAYAHPGIESLPLGTVPAAVFMKRDHPLAANDVVSLADVAPYPVALSGWFHEANESVVSRYREMGADLRFTDVPLDGVMDHLAAGGVLFTAAISKLGSMYPMAALRPLKADEAVPVPICLVFPTARRAAVLATVEPLFDQRLPFLSPEGASFN